MESPVYAVLYFIHTLREMNSIANVLQQKVLATTLIEIYLSYYIIVKGTMQLLVTLLFH